eukprot:TRINITY_DN404_c5_g1_i1.p1 TRINITY_DN404_c5_g1~~TRINITY_DN404_c5_g1_i1.p1  ORF type:complete len:345 (+),score=69.98 TRINITY_DN404_c5_g1_i1:63-1037(+)
MAPPATSPDSSLPIPGIGSRAPTGSAAQLLRQKKLRELRRRQAARRQHRELPWGPVGGELRRTLDVLGDAADTPQACNRALSPALRSAKRRLVPPEEARHWLALPQPSEAGSPFTPARRSPPPPRSPPPTPPAAAVRAGVLPQSEDALRRMLPPRPASVPPAPRRGDAAGRPLPPRPSSGPPRQPPRPATHDGSVPRGLSASSDSRDELLRTMPVDLVGRFSQYRRLPVVPKWGGTNFLPGRSELMSETVNRYPQSELAQQLAPEFEVCQPPDEVLQLRLKNGRANGRFIEGFRHQMAQRNIWRAHCQKHGLHVIFDYPSRFKT